MESNAKKTPYKRIALAISLVAILIWTVLGAGTSLAWFTDVSTELNNIFHVAKFDLVVSHSLADGSWEEVDSQTKVFEDNALYEPGYVQVVYLKVENQGTVPFRLSAAVNVNGYIVATNVFGQTFLLQDYLKFGIAFADTEQQMQDAVSDRKLASAIANIPLHNYADETAIVAPGEIKYVALVVHMPEEVGNVANYRGDVAPEVDLGITIRADQIR